MICQVTLRLVLPVIGVLVESWLLFHCWASSIWEFLRCSQYSDIHPLLVCTLAQGMRLLSEKCVSTFHSTTPSSLLVCPLSLHSIWFLTATLEQALPWRLSCCGSSHFRGVRSRCLLHHLHSLLVEPWHFTQSCNVSRYEIRRLFNFYFFYKSWSCDLSGIRPFGVVQVVTNNFFVVAWRFSEVINVWFDLELLWIVFAIVGTTNESSGSYCLLCPVHARSVTP